MKTIQFNGKTFHVPEWAKWITYTFDGVWVYEKQPYKSSYGTFFIHEKGTKSEWVGEIVLYDIMEIK